MNLFICYPKCSTCAKARSWLTDNNIAFTERHIVEANPTADELREWIKKSGLPARRFFNTSGLLYRSLELKDRLDNMSEAEMIDLLATNGMLVKRPLLVSDSFVLVGFKADAWEKVLKA